MTPHKNIQSLFILFCFNCLVGSQSSSAAEPKNNISDENSFTFEPIIVTAEKRPSELQKTPIAITTYTSDEIQNSGITSVPDLSLRTPGLVIGNNSNTSTPEIFIRGVGTLNLSIGSDTSIGVYVDDVYVGRDKAMFFELFDLERIEVLRGPQGTLYGRNTIGGAINIVTQKPTYEFSTAQQLKIGNFDLFNINGNLSGPIAGEKLLGRLSYSFKDREGYSKNVFNDTRLADADSYGGRASLWFLPTDNVDLLLNYDFHKDRPTGISYKPVFPSGTLPGHEEPSDPFRVNHDTSSKEERDIHGVSGKFTWDGDHLTLTSVSAYRAVDLDLLDDVDATSFPFFDLLRDFKQRQFSQEFRFSNDDLAQLRWIIGTYIFNENIEDTTSVLSLGTTISNISELKVESYAIFGQADYSLTNRLSFITGIRYTYEEKDFELERTFKNTAGDTFIALPHTTDSDNWSAVTPKFGLQFQMVNEVLIYGTISRGFKSGGYNSFQLEEDFQDSFDPEFLWAYEVGLKSSFFDQRLQLNVATFYYDHTDLQVQTLIPAPDGMSSQLITKNAAEAENLGVEIEILSRPVNRLNIGGSIAVLSTEYDEFINDDDEDVSGNDLIRSPELSTSLSIQYKVELYEYGQITLRGEHQYQSKIFFSETNERRLSQEGYHNINARLGYQSPEGRFSVAVFGRNLTDEETVNVATNLRPLGWDIRAFMPPRTYGIEITLRY